MESVLDKCLNPTIDMIANLIEIENAHINTNHPDFIGSADSLLNLFQTDQEQQIEDTNKKSKSYGLIQSNSKSPAEEIEVIEDTKEEDKGGYLSSFTGYLGRSKQKDKKTTPKINEKEEKKVEEPAVETMISKAQTRHKNEESAMKERQENFDLQQNERMIVPETDYFLFDR